MATTPSIAQQTPPILPRIQPTPLPERVRIAPPARPEALPDQPISADEAARIALANQPDVRYAEGLLEAARGRSRQAGSRLLPTLGVTAGYTHVDPLGGAAGSGGSSGGVVSTGSGAGFAGYQGAATIRQLVFDFGRARNLTRQSRSLERAAGANLTRVQSDLVLRVRQLFYRFQQNERLVAVNEANVRTTESQLALAEAMLRSGLGPPVDVVRAQTSVASAISGLTNARTNATLTRIDLAQAMGIDPRAEITASDDQPGAAGQQADLNALVSTALRQRPEVLEVQERLRAAGYGVRAASRLNAPSIYASIGSSVRGRDFPPNDTTNLTVGATVAFDVFNSGLSRGARQEAEGLEQAARADLASIELEVVSDVSQAHLNLLAARQRVVAATAEVANAEEGVRLAEGRYRSEVGTFLDVIDAQRALIAAQTNLVNARTAVQEAGAQIDRSTGAPLPATAAAGR